MPYILQSLNGWNGLCAHVSSGTFGTGGNVIPHKDIQESS